MKTPETKQPHNLERTAFRVTGGVFGVVALRLLCSLPINTKAEAVTSLIEAPLGMAWSAWGLLRGWGYQDVVETGQKIKNIFRKNRN
jgi:hypothetical protein